MGNHILIQQALKNLVCYCFKDNFLYIKKVSLSMMKIKNKPMRSKKDTQITIYKNLKLLKNLSNTTKFWNILYMRQVCKLFFYCYYKQL